MATFITPTGNTGLAELTASNGLVVIDQGEWRFSQAGYNDGITFGLSLTAPSPTNGGNLDLSATDWPIATVGNELTSYTDPDSGQTYPSSQCRIQVIGRWKIVRQPNSNSFNSIGVTWAGHTHTDQGDRAVGPYLLNYISDYAVYVIQGADVTGGAQDTFSNHDFYCKFTESAITDNSNKEFQSNTIIRPIWAYTYTKSWEITA